jgi:hypothetical protein
MKNLKILNGGLLEEEQKEKRRKELVDELVYVLTGKFIDIILHCTRFGRLVDLENLNNEMSIILRAFENRGITLYQEVKARNICADKILSIFTLYDNGEEYLKGFKKYKQSAICNLAKGVNHE